MPSLTSACQLPLSLVPLLTSVRNRRGRAGEQRALLVVRDAEGSVVACAGVEPLPFLNNVILVSPPSAERHHLTVWCPSAGPVTPPVCVCVFVAFLLRREEPCGRHPHLTLCAAPLSPTSRWPPPRGAGAWLLS